MSPEEFYYRQKLKKWFPLLYDEQYRKCLEVVSATVPQNKNNSHHFTDYLGCIHEISLDGVERIETRYGKIGIKTGKYLEVRKNRESILFLREDKVEPRYISSGVTLDKSSVWTQQLPIDSNKALTVYRWDGYCLYRDDNLMLTGITSVSEAEYYIIED